MTTSNKELKQQVADLQQMLASKPTTINYIQITNNVINNNMQILQTFQDSALKWLRQHNSSTVRGIGGARDMLRSLKFAIKTDGSRRDNQVLEMLEGGELVSGQVEDDKQQEKIHDSLDKRLVKVEDGIIGKICEIVPMSPDEIRYFKKESIF